MNPVNKNSLKRKPRGQNKGVYLYLKNFDEIEIQLLPGVNDIEEINSMKLRVNENDNIDIISRTLAEGLGCKITKENAGGMELLKGKPVAICGMTTLLIRLPTSDKQVTKKFIKFSMKISAQLDTNLIISNDTKSKLGLLPENSSHGVRKVFYQDYRRYRKKIKVKRMK